MEGSTRTAECAVLSGRIRTKRIRCEGLLAASLLAVSPLAVSLLAVASVVPCVSAATGEEQRDFPPLQAPGRPLPTPVVPVPAQPGPAAPSPEPSVTPEPYRLGVGDEVDVEVLAHPDLSGLVKIRPDGAITARGVGMVHALGRTPEEVSDEIEARLGHLVRHPHVDVIVTNFGEQRIFVMGEVDQPGDKPFYKGISALQAVAQCGGIRSTGSSKSVLVIRRTGPDDVELRKLNLSDAFDGSGPGEDLALRPYDIVFVPRTFIANLDEFISQYFRQTISPFTFYLEGWKALNVSTGKIKVVTGP
jgi:protein involved in polysaccharide export with SLBB domain